MEWTAIKDALPKSDGVYLIKSVNEERKTEVVSVSMFFVEDSRWVNIPKYWIVGVTHWSKIQRRGVPNV